MKQRRVARAASKVTDQDELVVVEGRFVGISRGNRLHFEVNPPKARFGECLPQTGEGKRLILLGFRADETHWPADHGVADRRMELPFGVLAEIGEDAGNQILESAVAAEYSRSGQGAIRK